MEKNLFWDKKISKEGVRNILRDELNPRFIYFAALLLSRTNNIKEVFPDYLDKITFCRNWRKIKSRMRRNKWSDARINFWDEVYKVTLHTIDREKVQIFKKRNTYTYPDMKEISNILRKTRKDKGWTQQELAKRVDLSQQTISFIENGNFDFSFRSLIKIIGALNLEFSLKPKYLYPNSENAKSIFSLDFQNISTQQK
jgi:HTH-type transcriptional regulator/antitoxin HipB